MWKPILNSIIGRYAIEARLVPASGIYPAVIEVTGPNGNTTELNWRAQLRNLNATSRTRGNYYMVSCIMAHEQVHESVLQPTIENTVFALESDLETNVYVVDALNMTKVQAISLMLQSNTYQQTIINYVEAWRTMYLLNLDIDGHHDFNNPNGSYQAELNASDTMRREITNHANSNGWQ